MSRTSKAAKTASTLGGALGVAAKIRRGQSATAGEMKNALLTLSQAYNSLKQSKRASDAMLDQTTRMLDRLLSRS